jgi:hypothetical protein
MVGDMCWDLEETQGMWIHTARCMNCGHLTEPTMEKNRQQTVTAGPSKAVMESVWKPAMGE